MESKCNILFIIFNSFLFYYFSNFFFYERKRNNNKRKEKNILMYFKTIYLNIFYYAIVVNVVYFETEDILYKSLIPNSDFVYYS